MKRKSILNFSLIIASASAILFSCSKSSNSSGGSTQPVSSFFPLAVNNSWGYKLKNYDTTTGLATDSTLFTLSISGTISANGITYYQFANSPDTNVLQTLGAINSSTLGSIDNQFGTDYYTFFVSGAGDSTTSVNSWNIKVASNGGTCEGTDKLYAHYSDTTLVNLDGTTFTNSMKNVILTLDCSGNKFIANIYFIEQGVGLVRYSKYIYNKSGKALLKQAWVLESETLN